VALVIAGASAVFAALALAGARISGKGISTSVLILAILWAPLMAIAAYCLFLMMDHQAALGHHQNVGIPVVAIAFWFLTTISGLVAAILVAIVHKVSSARRG
jgi:uncharacterized sodium:solute symporter family permease YidK